MLLFAGLGISGFKSIPSETLKILSDADIVYLEQFTSPISESDLAKLDDVTKNLILVKRWQVEDGSEILANAKKNTVVLLSYGDPYIATTHAELAVRAINDDIQIKTIHASSSLTSVVGECGLHFYKLGRIATIMNDVQSLVTPYYIIYKNIIEGNHTVLLLEYDQSRDFFLDPKDAMIKLLDTENGQRRNVITSQTFVIVASRIGFEDQRIVAGSISKMQMHDFGAPPHTLIIPGKMHFTETDALKVFGDCLDEPHDNETQKISKQMIAKYVPMVRQALKEIKPYYENQAKFQVVLENAQLYIQDAEVFLKEGQDEVAVLSIGYADGLVDALRMVCGLEPKM